MSNNDKNIILMDFDKIHDSHIIKRGRLSIFDEDTHELVFRGYNKVILAGSAFTAAKHFNITPTVKTPSYNSVLSLENSVVEDPGYAGLRREEICVLFAVGTSGCGTDQSQVYPVDYKKWIPAESLVPFRYPQLSGDITGALRSTYYGRKVISDRVAYYFKKFETDPVFKQQFVDGTPIDANIYSSIKADNIESFIELKLKITKDDCREFFQVGVGINSAKINTISLLTAWGKDFSGTTYYQDIRPLTQINIPNEPLVDLTKGLDIIYDIYY